LLLTGVISFFLLTTNVAMAGTAAECSNYSASTMVQIREAKSLGIPNINPPRWTEDSNAHYDWCLTVPKGFANSEYSQRQQVIDQFKEDHTIKQPAGITATGVLDTPSGPTGSKTIPVGKATGVVGTIPDESISTMLTVGKNKQYCENYTQQALDTFRHAQQFGIPGVPGQMYGNSYSMWGDNYDTHFAWCLESLDTKWPEKYKAQRVNVINNFVTNKPWEHCADEGGMCNAWSMSIRELSDGREEVLLSQARYGMRGVPEADNSGNYVYALPTHDFKCTADSFDADPLPYSQKYCEINNAERRVIGTTNGEWKVVGSEGEVSIVMGESINVAGSLLVRFGVDGKYFYKISIPSSGNPLGEQIQCNILGFGGDPALGITKHCYVRELVLDPGGAGSDAASRSWGLCANEGGQCRFAGIKRVRYGAAGNYNYYFMDESVKCNVSDIDDDLGWPGNDPAPGLKKTCFISDL
jgi:hypothetical protein